MDITAREGQLRGMSVILMKFAVTISSNKISHYNPFSLKDNEKAAGWERSGGNVVVSLVSLNVYFQNSCSLQLICERTWSVYDLYMCLLRNSLLQIFYIQNLDENGETIQWETFVRL